MFCKKSSFATLLVGKLILPICLMTALVSSCSKEYSAGDYSSSSLGGSAVQIGMASWYGDKEHNDKTASGKRFNKYAYTAAHKTLPFGTMVRVTNLYNGKDVIVEINDRGPFVRGRIIDLSYAAAKKIDMIKTGIAKVKVEVLSTPSSRKTDVFDALYTVQLGSFSSRKNALALLEEVKPLVKERVRIERTKIKGNMYYRVRVGLFDSKREAERVKYMLRRRGYRGRVVME